MTMPSFGSCTSDAPAARALNAGAAAAAPAEPTLLFNVATRPVRNDELELALPLLQRSAAAEPEQPGAHLMLFHVLLRLGRRAEAKAAIQRAATLLPDNKHVLARLAKVA